MNSTATKGIAMTTLTKAEAVVLRADKRFSRARSQVVLLNRSGWNVRVWGIDWHRGILVDGTDSYGDGFRGTIDLCGNLTGEPVHD